MARTKSTLQSTTSVPLATSSATSSTPRKTLDAFLQSKQVSSEKNTNVSTPSVHTHMQYGEYCRKYNIEDADADEFERLYYTDVIKANQIHNLIEVQFIRDGITPGAIVIDLDFRFKLDDFVTAPPASDAVTLPGERGVVLTRKYDLVSHIIPFIRDQMRHIYRLFELDSDSTIPVFILEKPHPREKDAITVSDGVHILIGLSAKRTYHTYLRNKAVDWITANWCNPELDTYLQTSNDANSICDIAVATGSNGWLKYMSRKKTDTMTYSLSEAFEYVVDDNWMGDADEEYDADFSTPTFGPWVQTSTFSRSVATTHSEEMFLKKHYRELSVRYDKFPMAILRACRNDEMDNYQLSLSRKTTNNSNPNNLEDAQEEDGMLTMEELRGLIVDHVTLNQCLQHFMDRAHQIDKTRNVRDMDVREVYEYTMSLPEKYFAKGSYNLRLNVGFALNTYHSKMLVVYIAFCAQRDNFDFAVKIPEICDKWASFVSKSGGVTYLSLRWWSRIDAPDKYEAIRSSTLDFFVENVIQTVALSEVNNPRKKFTTGYSDHDVARILYKMMGSRFRCISIKQNQWIYFDHHRWHTDDSGTTLRLLISTDLRDLFLAKARVAMAKISEITDIESSEYVSMTKRAEKIHATWTQLGDARSKDNIMKEARELFYERDILDKLDASHYLTCFNNGVYNIQTHTFRRGFPEDYITKCTGYDYIPIEQIDKTTLAEVHQYLSQLFPRIKVKDYVIDHLAAIFNGDIAINQCMHMYEGVGQNGKSMFVKLVCTMCGTYSAYMDVTFYTQDRNQMGRANPELYKIINARYVYSSEPTEGSTIKEGPMKQLTSGIEEMTAREPFGQLRTFIPQANTIIQLNIPMGMTATDHGSWRRIRRILFESMFLHKLTDDPNVPFQFLISEGLSGKFEKWAPALAAIAIERAKITNSRIRIELCPEVVAASAAYRKDQDMVAAFMAERLIREPGGSVKKSELMNEFNIWCTQNGDRNLPSKKSKELSSRMDQQYGKQNASGHWGGVNIISEHANYHLDTDEDLSTQP